MMRSLSGGLAAAALATTMLAPPAHAQYYGIDDPADAKGSLTDIYAMRVRHGADVVNTVVTFHNLRPDSSAGISVFYDTVKTRRGPEFVLTSGLGAGTDYVLRKARRWRGAGQPIDCDYEVMHKRGKERFRAKVSPECLGEPEEVRASVKMVDDYDPSHRTVDWAPERRRWSTWLRAGG